MSCEEIRDTFVDLELAPAHTESCPECRDAWNSHLALRTLKAPSLGKDFDLAVMAELDRRRFFQVRRQSPMEKFWAGLTKFVPYLAYAACVLLILWMGKLASTYPGPELRALDPERAKMWSNLPDAVPPAVFPGPSTTRRQIRLVKRETP